MRVVLRVILSSSRNVYILVYIFPKNRIYCFKLFPSPHNNIFWEPGKLPATTRKNSKRLKFIFKAGNTTRTTRRSHNCTPIPLRFLIRGISIPVILIFISAGLDNLVTFHFFVGIYCFHNLVFPEKSPIQLPQCPAQPYFLATLPFVT